MKLEKATLSKFGNNVKNLLNNMSSNHSIILDKGERYEGYAIHIFRALLSGPNSYFKNFIEGAKDD